MTYHFQSLKNLYLPGVYGDSASILSGPKKMDIQNKTAVKMSPQSVKNRS